jgi:molybdopterin converting factor small subunit
VQVTVHLFAGLRDVIGGDIVEEFNEATVTVSTLRERLGTAHEKLKPYLSGNRRQRGLHSRRQRRAEGRRHRRPDPTDLRWFWVCA